MKLIPRSFVIAVGLACLLSIVSGVAFGWLDGRWANQPDLKAQGAELTELPEHLGDWDLVEDQELEDQVVQMLRCYGSTRRVYRNAETGATVTVAVIFGPRGPIAVHTPEICYSGQGIQAAGDRRRVRLDIDGKTHELWQVEFLSKVDMMPSLEVHYAWTEGDQWQAAENPRFWLTNRLYKIQIAGPPTLEGQESASLQFLELFIESLAPRLKTS